MIKFWWFLMAVFVLSCQSKSKNENSEQFSETDKNEEHVIDAVVQSPSELPRPQTPDTGYAMVDETNMPHANVRLKAIYKKYKVDEPCYTSEKLQKKMAKMQEDMAVQAMHYRFNLSDKELAQMSDKDKFTYAMYHPEVYSQNCFATLLADASISRIKGQLGNYSIYGELQFSKSQDSLLLSMRSEALQMIRECIADRLYISDRLKEGIVVINGFELIPSIIEKFNMQAEKDPYMLTTLMLLMKIDKYLPFVTSDFYEKLYTKDEWNQGLTYITFSKDNQLKIIQMAQAFYALKRI